MTRAIRLLVWNKLLAARASTDEREGLEGRYDFAALRQRSCTLWGRMVAEVFEAGC